MKILKNSFVFIVILILPLPSICQKVNFSNCEIYLPVNNNKLLREAAVVLKGVSLEHTHLSIPINTKRISSDKPIIIICTDSVLINIPKNFRRVLEDLPQTKPDGFRIVFTEDNKSVLICGHDERGALYGVGYFLRKIEMRDKEILVPRGLKKSSSPMYQIRGHQLGYRPKTNAYDAWTVEQFDHYIRDLAIFGVNTIEIMPPKTDDRFDNDHMVLPAIKMITEQSRICQKYGLDCWMWYPNMGTDYSSPEGIQRELEERANVFKVLPKLNNVFVPGGDPGDLQPDVLFNFLGKMAVVLHKYHPNAKIWVSPQVFQPSKDWYDSFYANVNKGYSWLGGVVYGPWIKETIQEVRSRVRPDLPLRRYPDITHSLSCQYPIPNWDLAFAVTLGRECYNPRPIQEKHIHNLFAKYAIGSSSYSEGINDDVNKFVWSGQDWDPSTDVIETLRDYARLFIGPDYTDGVAIGILDLEENFNWPLIANDGVQRTLHEWQEMERRAPKEVLSNYRFQMCLLRTYYDAYTQRRLVYETELEQKAQDILSESKSLGSLVAIKFAKNILKKAKDSLVRPDLRKRCFELSDSLYKSIGSQLTISKPQEAQPGRGNFIDNIDLPLNNSAWLLYNFSLIENLNDEKDRQKAIFEILHRTDPGPGGYYDNLGSFGGWAHVIRSKSWEDDPGGLESPFVDYGVNHNKNEWVLIKPVGFNNQPVPEAWMTQMTTLYDTPLKMMYSGIDTSSRYKIRVSYTGRFNSHIKLVANGRFLIHDFIEVGLKPTYEFEIPEKAISNGKIELTWTCEPGERGTQVGEVWLMRSLNRDYYSNKSKK